MNTEAERQDDDELDDGLPQRSEDAAHGRRRVRAGTKRPRRAYDPAALKIETNVEIPKVLPKGRTSAWEPLLRQLEVGDSVSVPDMPPHRTSYIRTIAKRLGLSILVRPEGSGVRLWRVSAEMLASEDGL